MHPTKTLGPDGMPLIFYKKYWHIVRKTITKVVLHVLNTSQLPSNLNHTFITLILKKNQAVRVANFFPINLCNVIYKLIS